jgi:hypothetical protein
MVEGKTFREHTRTYKTYKVASQSEVSKVKCYHYLPYREITLKKWRPRKERKRKPAQKAQSRDLNLHWDVLEVPRYLKTRSRREESLARWLETSPK